MPITFRRALKAVGCAAGALVGTAGLYLGAALLLSRIPVAKTQPNAPADVLVFLHTNGVHTDIVVPVKTPQLDWSQLLPYRNIPSGDTPTWADLKFSTAFVAAFWLGSSAMHVTYLRALSSGPDTVPLYLSQAEYAHLVAYIQGSFRYDAAGRVQHIGGHSYGQNDAFYEARRVYSFLYTCNTWTNNALKACGQKACFWTPSDRGILYHYGR